MNPELYIDRNGYQQYRMKVMKDDISRRNFLWKILTFLGAGLTALVGIPVVGFVISPIFNKKQSNWIPIAWMEDLKANGPQEVTYSRFKQDAWLRTDIKHSVYVLKGKGNQLIVFSNICTHLGCAVSWDAAEKKFLCPCHGGEYDITGKVVGGPPQKPLIRLEHKIENGRLFIKES